MRLWLDDLRPMPEGYDRHVKTAKEAIEALLVWTVTHISFDHDLGEPECGTGYDVASWIERQAFENTNVERVSWRIHSANPVGRRNIEAAMTSADRYWELNGRLKL